MKTNSKYDFILFENYHQATNHKYDVFLIAKLLKSKGLKVAVLDIYHEDKEFAPRMLITAKKVSIVPEVIYCYLRRSSGSITTDASLQKKRCLSKVEIYERLKQFGKELSCRKDRQALSHCKYGMATYIWNPLSLGFIKNEGRDINLNELVPQFKHDVLNNLFYDRKPLHLLRQIIFLISPTLLKKLHKKL